MALSDQAAGSVDPYNYYFSAETIAEIPALYEKIKHFTAPPGPFLHSKLLSDVRGDSRLYPAAEMVFDAARVAACSCA